MVQMYFADFGDSVIVGLFACRGNFIPQYVLYFVASYVFPVVASSAREKSKPINGFEEWKQQAAFIETE